MTKSEWFTGLLQCEEVIKTFDAKYAFDYYKRNLRESVDGMEFCDGWLTCLEHYRRLKVLGVYKEVL
jgi:hypothetical protein